LRILIHGINFTPELVGVGKYTGEMATWLADRGHDVRAVTAPPFNPEWKVFSGYSGSRYQREVHRGAAMDQSPVLSEKGQLGGLVVFRCPMWVSKEHSGIYRLLHLGSFAISSIPVMLSQIAWKPDVVIAIEPTLFCAPAAWATGRLCRARTWLHIQDFEIDAGFELGMLGSQSSRRMVSWFERGCIAGFDYVSTISAKMLTMLAQKGVSSARCVLFPNWVDTGVIFPLTGPSEFRKELGIPDNDIVALYSGNMATKQGLEILTETAWQLQSRKGLWFVFCGEGPGKEGLVERASKLANVLCLPLQPLERLNSLLNLADIHLLPQKTGAADLVMPSKLTGILASGRPVVATVFEGTQLARVVRGKGLVTTPEDPSALASAIVKLSDDPALRKTFGMNARAYAVFELDKNKVLSRFEKQLQAGRLARSTAIEEVT